MTSSGPQTFTPPPQNAKPKTLATVLLVAENAEETLALCLKSLLKQSLKQIEILVIDNGSSDETPDILASASTADNRVRVITKAEPLPFAEAMNVGLREAAGQYFAIQHIGGISAPDRLAYQIQHMQNGKGSLLCACSAREEYPDGTQTDWLITDEAVQQKRLNSELSESMTFLGGSAIYDRAALLNSGGFEGAQMSDILYDAAFKLVHKGKFIGEPKLLYVERKEKPSFSDKLNAAKINLRLRNRYFPAQKLDNLKSLVKDLLK